MYIVEWADSTGVYSQKFSDYREATITMSELESNSMACSISTVDDPDPDFDDGSGWYWSNKERDYVGGK